MSVEVQMQCCGCGRWFEAGAQRHRKDSSTERCAECQNKFKEQSSSRTVPAPAKPTQSNDNLPVQPFGDITPLFSDIRDLVDKVGAPIVDRLQTPIEWLTGQDPLIKQSHDKSVAGEWANKLVQQKTALLQNLKGAALALNDLHHIQQEAQRKVLEECVRHEQLEVERLRLKTEKFKLEEEIAQQQALQEARATTRQLEETRKQVRLRNDINPPDPVKPVEQVETIDPFKEAIASHRRQFKAKATAKQHVISDFLKELQKIFRANIEDTVKAARIRVVMEAYKQEMDALPKVIREFLDEVEKMEGDRD
jgi:hypothetical protein